MKYLVEDIEVLKDIVNVKLKDEDFNISTHKIHIIAFANYYFSKGKYFDEEFFSKLLLESNYYFIKDSIITKLKIKDYSTYEIRKLLEGKLDEENITRLIQDLEKNNYLSDYNYVKNIFLDANNKLKGKLYIEEKIKNKGINEQLINSFINNYNEQELATKLVNKEYNKLNGKYPKNTILRKISYKLKSNGFSEVTYNLINDLIYIKETNNDELLKKDYLKVLKKYQNKYKSKDLERKVIESLLLKGYNYKSVKSIVEGMINDD